MQTRALAHLHPDTRERGAWAEGRGPIFGFWDWGGGHDTPRGIPRLQAMIDAGAESCMRPFERWNRTGSGIHDEAENQYLNAHQFQTHFLAYQFNPGNKECLGVEWDASQPEKMKEAEEHTNTTTTPVTNYYNSELERGVLTRPGVLSGLRSFVVNSQRSHRSRDPSVPSVPPW